ncbi:unnamed protein product [Calypogeia fissa]
MTSASVVSPEIQKIIERFFFHDKSVHPPADPQLGKRSVTVSLMEDTYCGAASRSRTAERLQCVCSEIFGEFHRSISQAQIHVLTLI